MRSFLLLAFVAVSCVAQQTAGDLDTKVASVLPTAEENRWLSIPWRTDLSAALKESQRVHKPVYMWVMDGHPLGCT
jgi:hypothetical protein